MSARKSSRKGGEVLVGPERRRRWSVEEKLDTRNNRVILPSIREFGALPLV